MATRRAVNSGSGFCRDCGGQITTRESFAWCENTTIVDHQQEAKDLCENLTRFNRRFCEHCGSRVVGVEVCGNCGSTATQP